MVAELCGVVGARASGVIPFLTAHVPMRYMCGRWTLCGCSVRCCLPSLGFSFCALFPSKFLGSVPLCVRCVWRVLLPVGGVLLLSTSPSRLPLDPYPPPAVGLLAASRLRCCVALYPRHPPWHACTLTPRSPPRCTSLSPEGSANPHTLGRMGELPSTSSPESEAPVLVW